MLENDGPDVFVQALLSSQVRTSIPVQWICAVERVDENAFQQPHVMQITTRDNGSQLLTMYMQCKVRMVLPSGPNQGSLLEALQLE